MARITVVGSFCMDHVAQMPRFPQAGESVVGTSIAQFPGGKGANQCVAIARLGGDVEMVGMLGNDAAAESFRAILKEEGICSTHVFSAQVATGVAQIQINEEGQNRICVIPSANYAFGMAELDAIDAVLRETELVVLQLELRHAITEEIIRRAHGYGVKILFNPAPAAKLSDAVMGLVDYLTPNETELSVLSGLPTETVAQAEIAARSLLDKGVGTVIVTLGEKGALLVNADGAQRVCGYSVQAVDTVAAGDSFNGALAVALIEGKPMEEAIRFANAMGALTVQKQGAIPSLHRRGEVEAFLKQQA